MIKLKINDKEYSIKTEWGEFTYSDYCKCYSDKPLLEKISLLTDIPLDLIIKLTFAQLAFVCDAISFTDEPENAFVFSKGYIDELNIGRKTYGDLENALKFIRKSSNQVLSYGKVIQILYGENIEDEKVTDVLGKGSFVLSCISKFLEEFKRLSDYEPSVEEMEAGVDELSKFGFFATAVQLARKYGKTHDEILAMPAREVYTTLLYDFEQSEVEKRLHQIRIRKK